MSFYLSLSTMKIEVLQPVKDRIPLGQMLSQDIKTDELIISHINASHSLNLFEHHLESCLGDENSADGFSPVKDYVQDNLFSMKHTVSFLP